MASHIPFVFTSAKRCARQVPSLDALFAANDDSYWVEAPGGTVRIPPPDVYHGFGPETELWDGYSGAGRPYGDFSLEVTDQLIGKFHDADIASETGFPLLDNNLVVSDFYHGPRIIETHWNPYIHPIGGNAQATLFARERPKSFLRITEDVLSLDFLWNDYYYHFVIDCLPKFLRLREDPRLDAMPILWRSGTKPYVTQYLRALGLWDRLQPLGGDMTRCDRLFLPSTTSPNGWTRRGLTALRDAVLPAFGIEPPARPHRMILLSRRDALGRRIANEAELEAALAPLGFELAIPGQMPVAEQIRMFAEARLVIGPHGSAWANIVYAQEGAAMLEVQPQGKRYHPAMYSIAKLMGVNYGSYMSDQVTSQGDMTVDGAKIAEMARALLELGPS